MSDGRVFDRSTCQTSVEREADERAVRIDDVSSLAIGEARTFEFQRAGQPEEAFVLRVPSGLVAFVNRCPHWDVDLDLGDGNFYDERFDRIVCRNHGALFFPTSGQCEYGPCRGEFLERLDIELDGADAIVHLPRRLVFQK